MLLSLFGIVLSGAVALSAPAQESPGHRVAVGTGTVLLLSDSSAGLVLWAMTPPRPGHRPSPDFVGWLDPGRVGPWARDVRDLLAGQRGGRESARLVAWDGGFVSVIREEPAGGSLTVLAFGHPRERTRWILEASPGAIGALVDTMERLAGRSRLAPPTGVGYANPTNRGATPDRTTAPVPAVAGPGGEVWASAELDHNGAVVAGSSAILWASRPELGRAVLAVLPAYRFQRKDGGEPGRLRIYQRFRVR